MTSIKTLTAPDDHPTSPPRPRLSKSHETSDRALSMPKEKRATYISRLVLCLEACLKRLGVSVDSHPSLLMSLEHMACLIHESMSISSRNYHSVQHVFDVAENLDNDDPIAVIAALFHDCVYYHVDGGLSELQYEKLRGAISETHNDVSTHPGENGGAHMPVFKAHTTTPCEKDSLLCLVEKIFGYEPGQEVNHQNGLNEFLSAMICVRELKPFLPTPVLAQVACCIEATIPFRSKDPNTGKTCMERLFDKLNHVNDSFDLGLSEAEVVHSVQRAADLGCSDVANFGTTDVLWFLDNTWSLLPESNEGLRRQYLYSIQQFQFAVFKMWGFFGFLKAEVVFPYFHDVPQPNLLAERVANAARNLHVGRLYVGAKLLSLSVLASFAELTGGDAPISLFMGDLPSRHSSSTSSQQVGQTGKSGKRNSKINSMSEHIREECHPYPDNEVATNIDDDVYEVLSKGRRTETSFDVKRSPMAAYLYSVLGDEELMAVLKDIKVYPMTAVTARALLKRLPQPAVEEISKHMAEVAISRTDKINDMMETLFMEASD